VAGGVQERWPEAVQTRAIRVPRHDQQQLPAWPVAAKVNEPDEQWY
jgi:hypothetical protein